MLDTLVTVRLEVEDPESQQNLKDVIGAIPGFRILNPNEPLGMQNKLACDLLIMEIGKNIIKEFQFVQSMQDSGIADEIFLTSSRTEPEILLEAFRTGAREFLPQPIIRNEVSSAFVKYKERRANATTSEHREKRGKIIAFTGSKGGVGTTTVAVNLAASFAKVNGKKSISLIDMNLLFGEIPIFLDIQSSFNWGEVTRDSSRLDSSYLMNTLLKHPSGIYVLPSPTRLDGMQTATPDNIEILLTQMRNTFNFVLVDCGNKLSDITLKIMELSDLVFIVSESTLPCLVNIKKLLEILQKVGYDERNIQVIINRHNKKDLISLQETERSLNKKVYWVIPNDYQNTMIAVNQGKTLEATAGSASLTKNFRQLASTFISKRDKQAEKSTFFGTLFGKKN